MTEFDAATLYAGLLLLIFLGLKINVGRARSAAKVSVGDGGNESLIRAMRTQSNAVEDVPICLIGLFALAALHAPVVLIHGLGGALVIARLSHAFGLGTSSKLNFGRGFGTAVTALVMLVTAGSCLWYALT